MQEIIAAQERKGQNALSEHQPQQKLVYSMREAAAVLGVSYITMHRLLKRGLIRSSSAVRHKIIPHFELERFLRDTTGGVR